MKTNKVKLLLRKLTLIIFSVWSYIPIIMGILIPMTVIFPLAYASWIIFSPLLFGYWKFDGYIPISPDYPFQFIFFLIIELIFFIGGIVLFLSGLYHLAKGRKNKISIVKTGLYNYIRHPQILGISLISLPFTLYIPGFNDLGIRIGEIFSWTLFIFILTIYSNLEEHNLTKKFPEEFRLYRTQTGFFLPKFHLRKKTNSKRVEFMTIRKRYLFLLLGYLILVFVIFIMIEILSKLGLIAIIFYF